jgi:hypothetical protein
VESDDVGFEGAAQVLGVSVGHHAQRRGTDGEGQDVDLSQCLAGGRGQPRAILGDAHIHGDRLAAAGLGGCLLQLRAAARGHQNLRPFLDRAYGQGTADTRRRADNQHALARQRSAHSGSSCQIHHLTRPRRWP